MKAQMNTHWILCKVMMIMAIAALAIAAFLGCSAMKTEGGNERQKSARLCSSACLRTITAEG